MIKNILQWLLVGTVALAANPEPSNTFTFGNGAAGNKVLKFNRNNGSLNPVIQWTESANTLQFSNDGTNFSDIGSGSGSGGSGFNVLTNPGFESGIAQGWTNSSGAFLAVNAGSNLLFGKGSATFQGFTPGNSFQSTQFTIPNGLFGANCAATMVYKGGDALLTFEVVDGSSNILASQVVQPSSIPANLAVTFVCPSSGTFGIKVIASNATAIVAVDQMTLGNNSIVSLSQASFIGEAHIDYPNCAWNNAGTGLVPMAPNVTYCMAPVVDDNPGPGTFDTTTITHLPKFTINNLSAGRYMVIMSDTAGVGGGNASMAISDGTTISGKVGFDTTTHNDLVMIGNFNYTSAGTRTFEVVGGVSGFSTTMYGDSSVSPGWYLKIKVYRLPGDQQQAFRADQVANSWSGSFIGASCQWVSSTTGPTPLRPAFSAGCSLLEKTNTNFGTVVPLDNGTPGDNFPGIIFSPSRVGSYSVCLNPTLQSSTNVQYTISLQGTQDAVNTEITRANTGNGANYIERNPICGIYKAKSTSPVTLELKMYNNAGTAEFATNGEATPASALDIILFQIDYPLPQPLLVNSLVTESNGVDKVVRFKVGTAASPCISDPCTITSQSGGVTVVNQGGVGSYTAHFAAGTFSAPPTCSIWPRATSVVFLAPYFEVEPTSTTLDWGTYNNSSTITNSAADIICIGPK